MIDDERSYSDAELSTLDLGALLAGGITGPDGRMRPDLQGVGSVAAAIQLDNQFVTARQVAEVAGGEPSGFVAPPLDMLVKVGHAAAKSDAELAVFNQWLGMVAGAADPARARAMNELHVLLLRAPGGNAEAIHAMVVGALRGALPNLRFVASYAVTGGSVDAVDIVAFQPGEDPADALRAAQAVPGAEVELLPAQPSLTLMAPGGGAPAERPAARRSGSRDAADRPADESAVDASARARARDAWPRRREPARGGARRPGRAAGRRAETHDGARLSRELDQRAVGPVERLAVGVRDVDEADAGLDAAVEVARLVGQHALEQPTLRALVLAEGAGGALVEREVLEQRLHADAEQRVDDREEADGERAVGLGARRARGDELAQASA